MQDFIVLGLIPGTSIQITFNYWVYAAISLLALSLVKAVWRRRDTIRTYIVALLISRVIARYQVPA